MATQSNTKRMMDALKRAHADIVSLTDWLKCELEKQNDDEVTWAAVNSLEHVRENMIETLASFSGAEQSKIQRDLDELHM